MRRRGVDARPFGYTTRKGGLLDHARALDRFITTSFAEAPPVLGFVTHSMGALVVRAWLGLLDAEARGQRQRIVMLSPPNRGSSLAEPKGPFSQAIAFVKANKQLIQDSLRALRAANEGGRKR